MVALHWINPKEEVISCTNHTSFQSTYWIAGDNYRVFAPKCHELPRLHLPACVPSPIDRFAGRDLRFDIIDRAIRHDGGFVTRHRALALERAVRIAFDNAVLSELIDRVVRPAV